MVGVSTALLTACGVPANERESHAADALAQKYGREFEITRVYAQKLGDPYYEVQAYPVDEPRIRFSAAIGTEDDGISDTYVERRVCAAIAGQAAKNLDELPGYFYLFARGIGPQPFTDNAEITIQDYARLDSDNKFRIEAFVVPESKDANAYYNGFVRMFDGLEYLNGNVRLYVVDEEQMKSVQDFFDENDALGMEFMRMTEEFRSFKIPYQKGRMEMGKDAFLAAMREAL